ncbi:hypothetical protein [Gordonia otitidis]|uniref:hypothetical protein n=1 Tax=Gordonia otitidis TaxID=249058 RepID=UPI00235759E4|nr:hypothetical protein [Gordonia otitidis]
MLGTVTASMNHAAGVLGVHFAELPPVARSFAAVRSALAFTRVLVSACVLFSISRPL